MEITANLEGVRVYAYLYVDRGDASVGIESHQVVEDVVVEVVNKEECIDRWGCADEVALKDILWDHLYENFSSYYKDPETWDRF